jgi:hypothetical protein
MSEETDSATILPPAVSRTLAGSVDCWSPETKKGEVSGVFKLLKEAPLVNTTGSAEAVMPIASFPSLSLPDELDDIMCWWLVGIPLDGIIWGLPSS